VVASRRPLFLIAGAVAFFAVVLVSNGRIDRWIADAVGHRNVRIVVPSFSPWGFSAAIAPALLFTSFLVPFLATDGVGIDLQERTHEIVMATGVTTGVYVAGRFIARLQLCLALSLLLLFVSITVGVLLGGASFNLVSTLKVWALIAVPEIVVLAGIGFALGTLWPARATILSFALVGAWLVSLNFSGSADVSNRRWRAALDPSGWQVSAIVRDDYLGQLVEQDRQLSLWTLPRSDRDVDLVRPPGSPSDARLEAIGRTFSIVVNRRPNLEGFILPRMSLVAIAILAVVVAARRFKRFADCL
jgi:hypothetical protein